MFTNLSIIYLFLPLCIFFYYLSKKNVYVLLLFSILFYITEGLPFFFLMLGNICIAYISGLLIEKYKKNNILFTTTILIGITPLIYFKYTDFFITNINNITNGNIPLLKLMLPLGISFYTFQLLSYLIDVKKGVVIAEKNLFHLMFYITFFPQLVAGPIVTYDTMKEQIKNRRTSLKNFNDGIFIFLVGLNKKVLIANQLGELCNIYHNNENTVLFTWMYAIAYSLQVYFDFSGYSDMAIGFGKMLGFDLPINFNYPYIAKSIKDFWSRWHITLSSFFKEYVYIPLGGSRCSIPRTIFNLFVVWFLTGFWHGASWNFIVWGLFFFVLLIIEKFIFKNKIKFPLLQRILTLFLVMISFIIFGATDLTNALITIKSLFIGTFTSNITNFYLLDYGFILLIAIIGATPLVKNIVIRLKEKFKYIKILEPIVIVILLLVPTAYLIDGSFNPFLYFRF